MTPQTKNKKLAIIAAIIVIVAAGVIGTYLVSAQTTETLIPITQEELKQQNALDVEKNLS